MVGFLASCFSRADVDSTAGSATEYKQMKGEKKPLLDAAGYLPGCPFCSVSREGGFAIVQETDDLIAFKDRAPKYQTHLLIIPRKHSVSTVPEMTSEHLPLLRSMRSFAHKLVPDAHKMGFHIPPFSSVHHLHLHVFAGEPTSSLANIFFPVRSQPQGKKWGWFVTCQQAIDILDAGRRIGLGSTR